MEKRFTLWLGLVLLVIVANGVLSYRALDVILSNGAYVRHSRQLLLMLQETFSTLQDAENGQRGYLLTGERKYLAPYTDAVSKIQGELNDLRSFVTDSTSNQRQQRQLRRLGIQVQGKLNELAETIELRDRHGLGAAQDVIRSNNGQESMDSIRHILQQMIDEENSQLVERSARVQESILEARMTFIIANIIGVLLLIVFARQTHRDAVERLRLLGEEQAAHRQAETAAAVAEAARIVAENASRLKDEFVATVSHELRTPLTAIIGWYHILNDGNLDPETTKLALETIERNAQSQTELINDLLDVSRIITGKLRLDVRTIDPVEPITAAIEAVRPAADAKDIRLVSVLDADAGPVAGDIERMKQIFWNILSNAIKFTPKGGHVSVRLQIVESSVEIVVSDDGIGISSEFLPFVFDRFRQGDSTLMRPHGGLGLGLAIARHLTEMHGGTISVDSQGEGKGSTFTLRFPVAPLRSYEQSVSVDANRHPEASSPTRQASMPDLAGLRLLVVDDHSDTLDVIRAILAGCGADVRTAGSAAEAMKFFSDWKPDLLVSDIGMPKEDGYALIARVRALGRESGGAIPAVALTAYARAEDRLHALSAGYQMHLPKPVEPSELAIVVASLAGRLGPTG
jgi:signal transduction histidine kinase/ActR/RegA family two-component response regulator